jgi:hypothetical protein
MTASDSEVPVPASTGAAVRFPVPPLLFAVPLALALAADRWVRRLPLPAAGRRGTQATGSAVAVGGALLSLSGVLTALSLDPRNSWGGDLDFRVIMPGGAEACRSRWSVQLFHGMGARAGVSAGWGSGSGWWAVARGVVPQLQPCRCPGPAAG